MGCRTLYCKAAAASNTKIVSKRSVGYRLDEQATVMPDSKGVGMGKNWNTRAGLMAFGYIFALMSTLIGCRKDISERPPEGGGMPSFATAPSLVGAAATVPMAQLVELVNTHVPTEYRDSRNGDDVCQRVFGQRVCAGTHYDYTVTRRRIEIERYSTDAIKISVPVSVEGHGGFRGDVARALGLHAKNFFAEAVLDILVVPKLNPDWCPQFELSASYRWIRSPRVEIVDRVWIQVSGPVEEKLNQQLPGLIEKARGALDCARFKSDVAKLYGTLSFPIALPWNDKLHVNLEPSDIAFSGLKVDQNSLRFAGVLTVKAEVSGTAVQATPLPLPPLRKLESTEVPRLSVALPLRVPYSSLISAVRQTLKGKNFQQDAPAGKVAATVSEVRIYPSKDKLVVGIDFDAKLPGKILDTKGSVYIIGSLRVDNGTRVALKDVSFTRILDNEVWNVLSALFDTEIRKAIEDAARYDLSSDIDKAKAALAEKLGNAKTIPGVKITASEVQMSLGRIAVASNELAIESLLAATVTMEIDPSAGGMTSM